MRSVLVLTAQPHESPHFRLIAQLTDGRFLYHGSPRALELAGDLPEHELVIGGADDDASWSVLDLLATAEEAGLAFAAAVVYRKRDGLSLRLELELALGEAFPSRVPLTGRATGAPADPDAAEQALELARARLGTEEEPGDVLKVRVAMRDVESGDLVEENAIPAHRWAGDEEG